MLHAGSEDEGRECLMGVKEDAIRMHQTGLSIREIAERLGQPRTTVHGWVQTTPRRSLSDIQDESKAREEMAVAMHEDGMSAGQIAHELGISKMQVTRLLRRAGVMT